MSLKNMAKQTLDLLEAGGYQAFAGAFERVTFAIYDRSKGREVGTAFERRLGGLAR